MLSKQIFQREHLSRVFFLAALIFGAPAFIATGSFQIMLAIFSMGCLIVGVLYQISIDTLRMMNDS